jgi:hypothetical protein
VRTAAARPVHIDVRAGHLDPQRPDPRRVRDCRGDVVTAPAAPAWPTEPCEGCKAPIVWAVTRNARPMPVDPEPAPDGNVLLTRTASGVSAEVVSNPARLFGRKAYRSHFVTCPKADRYRRPRSRR